MSSITKPLMIRKSNALIEASYKLTVSEQRLLVLLASTISPADEDFKDYEITVSEFARMFELELNKSLYDTLQNAALSLMKQQLSFNDDSLIKVIQWLSYIEYIKGSGVIKLSFDKRLKPHLLQLKERFTQYRLDNIVRLSGQYSARMYELLKAEAFKAKNGRFERSFQIDELRAILGIEENAYPIFNDLKLRVINPSINEISISSDLTVNEVKYGKTGRKITNVTFVVTARYFSEDETKVVKVVTTHELKPITPKKETQENQETDCPVINTLVAYQIKMSVAKKLKANYDTGRINNNIAYSLAKSQRGEIKSSFAGYLKSAIEVDYAAVAQTTIFDVVTNVAKVSELNGSKTTTEKQVAQDKAKAATEKAAQDKKSRNQQAFNDFLLLPENQQNELIQVFFEQSDLTIKAKVKDAERKGIDIFTSPLVFSPFKVFLVERGF
jgi:plasmid replication initiation protein